MLWGVWCVAVAEVVGLLEAIALTLPSYVAGLVL